MRARHIGATRRRGAGPAPADAHVPLVAAAVAHEAPPPPSWSARWRSGCAGWRRPMASGTPLNRARISISTPEQVALLVHLGERVSTVHVVFYVDALLPSFQAAADCLAPCDWPWPVSDAGGVEALVAQLAMSDTGSGCSAVLHRPPSERRRRRSWRSTRVDEQERSRWRPPWQSAAAAVACQHAGPAAASAADVDAGDRVSRCRPIASPAACGACAAAAAAPPHIRPEVRLRNTLRPLSQSIGHVGAWRHQGERRKRPKRSQCP